MRLLEDVPVASPNLDHELRTKLAEHMNAWFAAQSIALAQVRKLLDDNLPLGTLCDIFSFTLSIDIEVKQELLEQVDVEQRTRRLLAYLGPRSSHQVGFERPAQVPAQIQR